MRLTIYVVWFGIFLCNQFVKIMFAVGWIFLSTKSMLFVCFFFCFAKLERFKIPCRICIWFFCLLRIKFFKCTIRTNWWLWFWKHMLLLFCLCPYMLMIIVLELLELTLYISNLKINSIIWLPHTNVTSFL